MEEQKSSEHNIQLPSEEVIEKLSPEERRFVEVWSLRCETTVIGSLNLDKEELIALDDALKPLTDEVTKSLLIDKSGVHMTDEEIKKTNTLEQLGVDLALKRLTEQVKKGIFSLDEFPEGFKRERDEIAQLIEDGKKSENFREESKLEAPIESFIKPNERRQNKIIKILKTGNYGLINEREVQVSSQERAEVLGKIKNGEITVYQFEDILEEIGAPFQDQYGHLRGIPKGIKEKINSDNDLVDICHSINIDIEKKQFRIPPINLDEIDKIVTVFSNPHRLERFLTSKIKGKEQATKAFELMGLLYGKREEYRRQMELLQEEARK